MPDSLYNATVASGMPNGPNAFAPMQHDGQYNTPLTPGEQQSFADWAKAETAKRGGRDVLNDKHDYDIQGFWKSQQGFAENGHGSDQFKKPNHPTFSDQSQYALGTGLQPGHWDQGALGRDRFVAGQTNLQNMQPAQLRNYFRQVEPGVSLDMPTASPAQRLRSVAMPAMDPFFSKQFP